MPFPYEKLQVYQESLKLVERLDGIVDQTKLQISHCYVDQITRAALSVPINIAEGCGRWHPRDRAQFFRIARGSVFECAAILELIHRKKVLSKTDRDGCYAHLEWVAKMLSSLISSTQPQGVNHA